MAVKHTEMVAMLRSRGATSIKYGHRSLGDAAADVIEDQDEFVHSLRGYLIKKGLWGEYCTGVPADSTEDQG